MTTKPKFYITTAIDYPNGVPHLGHAFEKTGADCIARYRRLRGDNVQFVVGMDEHAQKVAQAADEAGVDRQEWIDDIAEEFRLTWALRRPDEGQEPRWRCDYWLFNSLALPKSTPTTPADDEAQQWATAVVLRAAAAAQ